MKLDEIRKKVDILDEKILDLLHDRFILVQQIKKLKEALGIPVEDKKREEKMINNLILKGEKLKLSQSFISQLFVLIISESKRIQKYVKFIKFML